MKISVVIPTMNEEESIGDVMDEINKALSGEDYEVLIVDTESTDKTREIARSKGARVVEEPRRGYGRAYKTGFEEAEGDIIATLDADCTYPASKIPEMVVMIEDEGYEFISTDRLSNVSSDVMGRMHRFGNWVLKATMNLLFRTDINDSQSGMWVFKRSALRHLNVTSDGMPFSEEIKIEAIKKGVKFDEVPIEYRERKGEAKIRSFKDGFKNFFFLWKKRLGLV
ncbi:MAG: glycosyltransferase family 2 protein [Candidatus Natronoplasma sp.]